ncbi:hypothetical protein QBC39DRAFT_431989 [Podospora conica]|nr:hypothetical protein QBC39DRAFT_431989 [Schizothecium conicum]
MAGQLPSPPSVDHSGVQIKAVARMFRGDPEDVQITILIILDRVWSVDDDVMMKSVATIVQKLKSFIDECKCSDLQDIDIAVEVVSRNLINPKFVSAIDYDTTLARSWLKIRDGVQKILDDNESTREATTSISLIRLGYSPDHYTNPKTVYVTLDYSSSELTWPLVLRQLQGYVDRFHMDLVVHMEHNVIEEMIQSPLVKSVRTPEERQELLGKYGAELRAPYTKAVRLGGSLSATSNIIRSDGKEAYPTVGTLGCWVEIKTRYQKSWQKMGLTCYHVFRPCLPGYQVGTCTPKGKDDGLPVIYSASMAPAPNSLCLAVDKKGIVPKKVADSVNLTVEHPARMRHVLTVDELEARIAQLEKAGLDTSKDNQELAQKIKFFDEESAAFGKLHFASGYLRRSKTGGRLDWALIKPDDDSRVGRNLLPSLDWFEHRGYPLSRQPFDGDIVMKSQALSLHDHVATVDSKTAVIKELSGFKLGATTGATAGRLSAYSNTVKIGEENHLRLRRPNFYSNEYCFVDAFAGGGDSGAAVYDEVGRIIGLVFRGQQPHQAGTERLTYVTPIEDIFKDIKDISQGDVVGIRLLRE